MGFLAASREVVESLDEFSEREEDRGLKPGL